MNVLLSAWLIHSLPTVVMVHGAGGGGWEYKYWRPIFEQAGCRVEAPDMVPVPGGLAKTRLRDYVNQTVRACGSRPVILVGASMGGVIVLKAASRVNVKALVLVSSAIPAGVGVPGRRVKYPAVLKWSNGPYSDTVASMPDTEEAIMRDAWPRWRDESGSVLGQIAKGVAVARPRVPVMSVIPDADETVPASDQRKLATWARADVRTWSGMSHIGPLFSWRKDAVADSVIAWLRVKGLGG